jgi:glucose 1-dehydrogenase
MKAVALDYQKRELREVDLPEPELERDGQVLFRVREVGICGTDRDLASFRLAFPSPSGDLLVIGHECVGEVIQTNATTLKPGDIVVPLVRRPCHPPCRWCARKRRDRCTGAYTERGISGAHGYFTELAIDAESDLVRIPPEICEHAVLIEPLSVVEKAIGNAFRLHPGQPETALILGAGTVGLLAAMVLKARGVGVTVSSPEPPNSDRARLVEEGGSNYLNRPEGPYDIIIEAAGAVEAAGVALEVLGPSGVLVMLGVNKSVEVPMLRLIVRNQAIVGSVNAAPEDFELAVDDLTRMPPRILRLMLAREPFSTFRSTLTGPLRAAPKIVHVIG